MNHPPKQLQPFEEQQDLQNDDVLIRMSEILGDLYGSDQIDAENVSVHSAFICLLHIANEKGLALETEREADLCIYKAI